MTDMVPTQIDVIRATARVSDAQIEAATNAVRDEYGSKLCNWTDRGTERECWADSGRTCMCRNIVVAVLESFMNDGGTVV